MHHTLRQTLDADPPPLPLGQDVGGRVVESKTLERHRQLPQAGNGALSDGPFAFLPDASIVAFALPGYMLFEASFLLCSVMLLKTD